MEMKITVVHTASPELLAVLGGLLKNQPVTSSPSKNGHPVKPVVSLTEPSKQAEQNGEVTITEIRELATKLSKNDGKGEKVKSLLSEFNCKAVTGLKADQYEGFYEKLKAL